MRITITCCIICLFGAMTHGQLYAQTEKRLGSVTGTVIDARTGEALPYVQIMVKGTTLGTVSDANGNFSIKGIPVGKVSITASNVGYGSISENISIQESTNRHLDLYMKEETFELDGVVVTADRNTTMRRKASTLVTVIPSDMFIKTNACNLSQGLKFQSGLRVENNCQNCGFNQVRINGLDGAYSQILIDSRPMFSSLAGVYGLEQIPANMIERVEVLRGGGSALFGSNAIGGVINIITKDPICNSAQVSNTLTSFNREGGGLSEMQSTTNVNVSMVTDDRRGGISFFGQHNYRPGFDYDGDSFTELPVLRNRGFGFRSFYKTGLYSKINAELHSMQEYRRGGDRLDNPPFEAQIAEYLQHFVNGGSLKFDQGFKEGRNMMSLYLSAQNVHRKSYYGGGDYIDKQLEGITDEQSLNEVRNALTSYGTTKGFDLQGGGTYFHNIADRWNITVGAEASDSHIKDRSGYRVKPIDQENITISQFDQVEFKTDRLSLLLGGRFDYVTLRQEGKTDIDPLFIFSPRANLRYNPVEDISLRLSYSEGFRAPQYFDEEMHVELAGGTPVTRVLSKELKEEHSRSVSGSIDWYGRSGDWQFNLMLEGFATFISDQFIASPVEREENGITIRTIVNQKEGTSKVYGMNLEGRLAYGKLFDLQLGTTLQRSRYGLPVVLEKADEKTGQRKITTWDFERTPNLYGYFVATLRPTHHLSLNLNGTFTGAMKVFHKAYDGEIDATKIDDRGFFNYEADGQCYKGVAEGFAYLKKTPAFFEMDFKAAYEFHLGSTMELELNAGAQNIFNSFQSDMDKGPGRASDFIYGPMLPRRVFVGTKISF
ncbi:TonB-dependent receptor [Bacteroides heparinolyticus]|uniref:TonB-dependent receptor n=1 Tax=Prevotella heparinolytica TaxID=28113 RepID=UPI00403A56A1